MADALDLAIARPINFDPSVIGDPFAAYAEGQKIKADRMARQALANGLPRAPDGSIDFGAAVDALAKAGAPMGTLGQFAQLATSAHDRAAQRDYQNRSLALQEKRANAEIEGAKVPQGFERNPMGGLQPVKGGPTDPNYIEATSNARDKGKKFSVTDISKLSDEGGRLASASRFAETFKPEYAGYKSQMVGEAAMSAGRTVPGVVGALPGMGNIKEAANFWQDYDRYKNDVRHTLFGSALTKNEQAAFERADINPGMDPVLIQRNLARQQDLVMNGIRRKSGALVENGYDPDAIAKAYGVTRDQLGIAEKKKAAPTATTSPGAAASKEVRISTQQDYAALPSGTVFIAPDGSRRVKP